MGGKASTLDVAKAIADYATAPDNMSGRRGDTYSPRHGESVRPGRGEGGNTSTLDMAKLLQITLVHSVEAFSQCSLLKRNIDGTRKSVLDGAMKTKTIGLILALCFFAGAACFAADDPQMGTWKLNESKSKLTPGDGKEYYRCV